MGVCLSTTSMPGVLGDQKGTLGPLGLELRTVLIYMWVLGIELMSSGRETDVSPASQSFYTWPKIKHQEGGRGSSLGGKGHRRQTQAQLGAFGKWLSDKARSKRAQTLFGKLLLTRTTRTHAHSRSQRLVSIVPVGCVARRGRTVLHKQ